MFGRLSDLFAAIGRLAVSLHHAADLVDHANREIEQRMFALPGEEKPLPAPGNGRRQNKKEFAHE